MSETSLPTAAPKPKRGRPSKTAPRSDAPTLPTAPLHVPLTEWSEAKPDLHLVIQGFAGPYRGILAQIGEIQGNRYRCYVLKSNAPPEEFIIAAADCIVIGKGKVAARNPFPAPAQPPLELPPEQDPSTIHFGRE